LVPRIADTGLAIDVTRLWLAGVTLPAALAPRSTAREWQDGQGALPFRYRGGLPRGGLPIRYHGWLAVQ
jgi:hypothetical protein